MTAATYCPLNGALDASLNAATWTPNDDFGAVLSPVFDGGMADLRVPVSGDAGARQVLSAIGDKLRTIDDNSPTKAIEIAGTAADLWQAQLTSAVRRFETVVKEVLDEARSIKKYTPEMAKRIVAERGVLLNSLHDSTRINRAFRIDTKDPRLLVLRRQAALDKNLLALGKVSESSQGLTSKKLIQQTLRAPLIHASEPILVDQRLAKKLGRMNTFMVVIQLSSDASLVLSAKSDDEQRNAIAKLMAGAAVMVAQDAAISLCVFAGPAVLGCGLGVVMTGVIFGESIENFIHMWLYKKLASDTTPVGSKAVLP